MMVRESQAGFFMCVRSQTDKCVGAKCMAWKWLHPTMHWIDANGVLQEPEFIMPTSGSFPETMTTTIGYCGAANG